MKARFSSVEQVNNLREIQALRRLTNHPNIIKLYDVVYDRPSGKLALVFELMDLNIYELIKGRRHYLSDRRVSMYMYMLLKSIDTMHRHGIFHRDIKPENILISGDQLRLADFGSCRGVYSKPPFTEYISTRWYRAPECCLTDGYYNHKMDVWGVGCCMFEVIALYPLFPGTDEADQVAKIHKVLGTPDAELLKRMKKFSKTNHINFDFPACTGSGLAKLLPHASPDCVDLLTKLLCYNPDKRISARSALRHPYFAEWRERDEAEAETTATPRSPRKTGSPTLRKSHSTMSEASAASVRSGPAAKITKPAVNPPSNIKVGGAGAGPGVVPPKGKAPIVQRHRVGMGYKLAASGTGAPTPHAAVNKAPHLPHVPMGAGAAPDKPRAKVRSGGAGVSLPVVNKRAGLEVVASGLDGHMAGSVMNRGYAP